MKAALFAVVFALLAVAAAANGAEEAMFVKFIQRNNKVYNGAAETFRRFAIFRKNLADIEKHNNQIPAPSYTMGVGPFTDLTYPEFANIMGLLTPNGTYLHTDDVMNLADIDWRQKGAVAPVQNQLDCGSCWAFSAVGALEGAFQIKHGALQKFSEQQLVDCSSGEGNKGCQGGLMDNAFNWYIKSSGACTETSYPYHAKDGTCETTCSPVGSSIVKSFTDLADEKALGAAIGSAGPVSVAVGANEKWQHYTGGIFNDGFCFLTQLNHGVLAVGISDNGGAYIIKNSWGEGWGESGFMRLITGKNMCGVASASSYPSL